jgi:hypothetical protein
MNFFFQKKTVNMRSSAMMSFDNGNRGCIVTLRYAQDRLCEGSIRWAASLAGDHKGPLPASSQPPPLRDDMAGFGRESSLARLELSMRNHSQEAR